MRDTSLDLFDPRTVMDSDYSPNGGRDGDFGFAFNDSNFSDRVLRIEIMADSPETGSDGEGCHGLADWARYRKRRREDVKKDNAVDTVGCPEEQILSCNQPDTDDGVGCENQDEEAVAMIEESPSGDDEAGNSNDSNWSMDCSTVLRVKTLHISSPILAAKSPFFYKLFSNGMRESEQRHVALRINASEEAALMELLNFMYSNTLSTTSAPALLDVLMAADKFEVASCMRYCSRLLRNLPMTPESALLYLPRKLKKVLTCNDFDHDLASKVVLEALFFKAEAPHRQRTLAAEESATINRRFIERAYKYRPVKVVEFELPRQQCVVYLDLKREECANLFPSGRVYSQAFHLGGQGFFLSAHCNMDQQSSFHCFGLFLGMQEKGSVTFAVDYEFAARSKLTEEYISKYKGNYTFTGGKAVGYRNLFAIQWTSFMAEDSLYFLNGILHLRAELTIRH
ncbi:BTB/POZ domain-containing protein POB1-like [Camellia sinensis]|uniref:BTB domain-containing protein n=1 Tax=Camellia sinensis var. sinensis TaxID=542762 RepID=A0A4V3WN05_CAMSN|nr:BTB/POZ domain-containing protein POB1-like [Camellia sinensis]THG10637.1 hypothetical protein TEA_007979 [Camellia sinensis var. sinensis]